MVQEISIRERSSFGFVHYFSFRSIVNCNVKMDKIKGKTVAITGGSSGLGYKYAEDLLKNGAKVSF